MSEEKYPISEELKVIRGQTLYKSEKWWAAVVLLESFGRRQVAFYLWLRKSGEWKRNQKYVVRSRAEWMQIRDIVEKFMPELTSTQQSGDVKS